MKKSLVAKLWQQYLDDSSDRLKMCCDGYVLTEKPTAWEQFCDNIFIIRGEQRSPLEGSCMFVLKLAPAACTMPGYEINSRQCHDSSNHMEASTKISHDKHFTTRCPHIRDSYNRMETRL
jgi:hypothetical protein